MGQPGWGAPPSVAKTSSRAPAGQGGTLSQEHCTLGSTRGSWDTHFSRRLPRDLWAGGQWDPRERGALARAAAGSGVASACFVCLVVSLQRGPLSGGVLTSCGWHLPASPTGGTGGRRGSKVSSGRGRLPGHGTCNDAPGSGCKQRPEGPSARRLMWQQGRELGPGAMSSRGSQTWRCCGHRAWRTLRTQEVRGYLCAGCEAGPHDGGLEGHCEGRGRVR